jgi:two-component system LytT family response regulator
VNYRVLVADDELLAREIVINLLARDREVDDIIECADGASAERLILSARPAIAFLDIEMPGENGLTIARDPTNLGPVVVFTTAFSRYAVDAFALDAIDYILKPFSDERFFQALDRAKRKVRDRRLGQLAVRLAAAAADLAPLSGYRESTLPDGLHAATLNEAPYVGARIEQILWIEAQDYYAMVHATTGHRLVRVSLAALEERLDPDQFLRVHRGAIVNLRHIRKVRQGLRLLLILSDGTQVAVSRARRQHVESVIRGVVRVTDAE